MRNAHPLFDSLWLAGRVATMDGATPHGLIMDAAIGIRGESIVHLGPIDALPGAPGDLAGEVVDCRDALVTPGLIDCHTHLVFGGERWAEFEMRLAGASYESIARAGGGIVSTVAATRAADEESLFASAARRLAALMADGVTTIEIKSGYGLDFENEIKMLRVARRLGAEHGVDVVTSFLGAHAIPPEFRGRSDAYITEVVERVLPAIAAAGLADAVDGFCEGIAFSPAETRRLFIAARRLGLPVKLHADQLSDLGGAGLAAEFGALSADHLEHASPAGIAAMAAAGTVAVLLPGASYFIGETRRPPVAALRAAGVPIALASNCNPGSSPTLSTRLMMSMGCVLFGLTPGEALAAVTINAARALGLGDRGQIAVGKRADLAAWPVAHPAELAYWLGGIQPTRVAWRGRARVGA